MLHYQVVENLIRSYWGDNPNITFLEIGAFKGDMERNLINIFPNIKVISIEMGYNPFNEDELKRIRFINKKSTEAWKDIPRNSVDFVYIDGDHSYKGCLEDIVFYFPLLKSKSILGGHDYHPNWGVIRAVDQMFGDVNYGEDLTWWISKYDLKIEGSINKPEWKQEILNTPHIAQQDQIGVNVQI